MAGDGWTPKFDAGADVPVSVEPYELPLARPLAIARGTLETREGFLVRIEHDGTVGVGEAAPLPAFTESLPECQAALESIVETAEESGIDAAHDALDAAVRPAATHGFVGASLDAAARTADQPLYRLLGGDRRETIPVNAVVGDGSPETTAAEAEAAVADGFDCVKIKVGAREPTADADRLRTVREAVGSAVTLRADANGAWSRSEATRALDAFEGIGLQYVEQPVDPGNLRELAAVREGPVPVAIDEGLTVHGVDEVLAARAADALIVKPMAHGSPAAARAIALAGLEAGLTVTVTTTIDAVVGRTAAVHVAASLPSVAACGLATADRFVADLGPDPAPVAAGEIAVPQTPGLGVEEVST
jgi:o-succinylbenzoate synthase